MNWQNKFVRTELNEKDRKVLEKYTKFYTNFIESNTVKSEILDDARFKGKE
ncbi:MAG: hypothetical protein GX660_09985 [Clostridiaceae bacterium]|nr:hypothetical protein [Clostridiaceae bacterium]